MLANALNQRYATVEDIFVKFVAPELQGRLTDSNDTYFLYTPYKNICPTKALVEKGITMHYTPYHKHKQYITAYNDLIDNEDTNVIKVLGDYCNTNDISLTTKFIDLYQNNDDMSYNQIKSLRLYILACFNYINTNLIALYDIFEDYSNLIASPDFIVDNSNYGTDSNLTLNIGFIKLSNNTLRNTMHISNINEFSVLDMINVYKKCVFKDNLDVVYTTYKFEGYKVIDNSEVHTNRSLCRLCDIVKIGQFEITQYNNIANEIYDFDQYAAFSSDPTISKNKQIYPSNPFQFLIVSHYVNNNYALPFLISNVQITAMTDNGLEYIDALNEEATTVFVDDSTNRYSNLRNNYILDNKLTQEYLGGHIWNNAEMLDYVLKAEESTTETPMLNNALYDIPQKARAASNDDAETGDNETSNSGSSNELYTSYRPAGLGVGNNIQYNQINQLRPGTANSAVLWSQSQNINNYNQVSVGTVKFINDKASLNTKDTISAYAENITSISSLKYANSALLIKNVGVGLIPYIDNMWEPTYFNAKTNIDPNKYTQYSLCFVTKNYNINKRTAIVTLTLNESRISKDIVISQWGSPLIVTLKIDKPISNVIYEHGEKENDIPTFDARILWRFKINPVSTVDEAKVNDTVIDLTNLLYAKIFYDTNAKILTDLGANITSPVASTEFNINVPGDPSTDHYKYSEVYDTNNLVPATYVLFQTETKYYNATNSTLDEQFYVKYEKVTWYELVLKIYFNSYDITLPDILKRIVIQYGYEPVLVPNAYKKDAKDTKDTKISEDPNLTNYVLSKPENSILVLAPLMTVKWQYENASNIWSQYIEGYNAGFSDIPDPSIVNNSKNIDVSTNIDYWTGEKDGSTTVPEFSLNAFNQENLKLTILSKRYNTWKWQNSSLYNYNKIDTGVITTSKNNTNNWAIDISTGGQSTSNSGPLQQETTGPML